MAIQLTNFKYGKIFVSDKDFYIGKALIHSGQYCDEEIDILKSILRPGDTVMEVGANIGSLSIPISQMIGGSGVLYCFEPQKYIFDMLCDSIVVNGISNIKTKQVAIGDVDREVVIPNLDYESMNNFGGIAVQEGGNGNIVRQCVLDAWIDDLTSLRLIKIDVEGMEVKVIKGGLNLIKKHRPFIYCENDRPTKSYNLLKALTDLDYRMYKHVSHVFSIPNFRKNGTNVFGKDYLCTNVLAVPKECDFKCDLEPISTDNCLRWA